MSLRIGYVLALILFVTSAFAQMYTQNGNTITYGGARFQVLSDHAIRLEYSPSRQFVDTTTAVVRNRDFGKTDFTAKMADGKLIIKTSKITLRYQYDLKGFTADNLQITWQGNGIWKPGTKDLMNLGGTLRSCDAVSDSYQPNILPGPLSRCGWYLYDDSKTPTWGDISTWLEPKKDNRATDWYFFVYGDDLKLMLKDYAKLMGNTPLIPKWALGAWYSKYYSYTDTDLKNIALEFRKRQIPLDVLVIDVDWHLNYWEGYDWDPKYFPDPAGYMKWMHDLGIKTTLNTHPGFLGEESRTDEVRKALGRTKEEGVGYFNLADKKYADVFMQVLHNPLIDMGVDFWWIDGEAVIMDGLNANLWTSKVYYDGTEKYTGKRTLIFTRWGGDGNHRYPVGFSGDTTAGWGTLQYQVAMTPIAGNVLWQWSHDVGGFFGDKIDDELYVRWAQFGALSPIMRFHSNHGQRLPWEYGETNAKITGDAFRLRQTLNPFLYTLWHVLREESVSPFTPLYIEYPKLKAAYQNPYEYLAGKYLLVAPALSKTDNGVANVPVYLPPGKWFDYTTGKVYNGDKTIVYACPIDRIPIFAKAGAIVPTQPLTQYIDNKTVDPMIINVYRGGDGEFNLYEDDGDSLDYQKGVFRTTKVKLKNNVNGFALTIMPAVGTYKGAPSTRRWKVVVNGLANPKSVKLNGKSIETSFDENKGVLTIEVKAVSVNQKVTLTVADPNGFEVYQRQAALRDTLSRLKSIQNPSALVSDLIVKLENRLKNNANLNGVSDEIIQTAKAILNSGDTSANKIIANRALGYNSWSSLQQAQMFGYKTSIYSVGSVDDLLEISPVATAEFSMKTNNTNDEIAQDNALLIPISGMFDGFAFGSAKTTVALNLGDTLLKSERTYPMQQCSITKWKVLGPFANPDCSGNSSFNLENLSYDPTAEYETLNGKSGWIELPENAVSGLVINPRYMDLTRIWNMNCVCAYAYTVIKSDKEQQTRLEVGSDDGLILWVNGVEMINVDKPRGAAPNQNHADVTLKQGDNLIMLKVTQVNNGWGFYYDIKTSAGTPIEGISLE